MFGFVWAWTAGSLQWDYKGGSTHTYLRTLKKNFITWALFTSSPIFTSWRNWGFNCRHWHRSKRKVTVDLLTVVLSEFLLAVSLSVQAGGGKTQCTLIKADRRNTAFSRTKTWGTRKNQHRNQEQSKQSCRAGVEVLQVLIVEWLSDVHRSHGWLNECGFRRRARSAMPKYTHPHTEKIETLGMGKQRKY